MTGHTVEFDAPAGFTEFTAADSAEEAYELVLENFGERSTGLTADQRRAFTTWYMEGSHAMAAAGTIWAGTWVGTLEDRPSMATLSVSELETAEDAEQETVAAGLMELLAPSPDSDTGAPHAHVELHQAPAGPTVVALSHNPGWEVAPDEWIPLLSAKAYIPMPAPLRGILIIDLTTPSTDHWPHSYAPLLVHMVRSVRFPAADHSAGQGRPATELASTVPPRPGASDDPFGTVLQP